MRGILTSHPHNPKIEACSVAAVNHSSCDRDTPRIFVLAHNVERSMFTHHSQRSKLSKIGQKALSNHTINCQSIMIMTHRPHTLSSDRATSRDRTEKVYKASIYLSLSSQWHTLHYQAWDPLITHLNNVSHCPLICSLHIAFSTDASDDSILGLNRAKNKSFVSSELIVGGTEYTHTLPVEYGYPFQ